MARSLNSSKFIFKNFNGIIVSNISDFIRTKNYIKSHYFIPYDGSEFKIREVTREEAAKILRKAKETFTYFAVVKVGDKYSIYVKNFKKDPGNLILTSYINNFINLYFPELKIYLSSDNVNFLVENLRKIYNKGLDKDDNYYILKYFLRLASSDPTDVEMIYSFSDLVKYYSAHIKGKKFKIDTSEVLNTIKKVISDFSLALEISYSSNIKQPSSEKNKYKLDLPKLIGKVLDETVNSKNFPKQFGDFILVEKSYKPTEIKSVEALFKEWTGTYFKNATFSEKQKELIFSLINSVNGSSFVLRLVFRYANPPYNIAFKITDEARESGGGAKGKNINKDVIEISIDFGKLALMEFLNIIRNYIPRVHISTSAKNIIRRVRFITFRYFIERHYKTISAKRPVVFKPDYFSRLIVYFKLKELREANENIYNSVISVFPDVFKKVLSDFDNNCLIKPCFGEKEVNELLRNKDEIKEKNKEKINLDLFDEIVSLLEIYAKPVFKFSKEDKELIDYYTAYLFSPWAISKLLDKLYIISLPTFIKGEYKSAAQGLFVEVKNGKPPKGEFSIIHELLTRGALAGIIKNPEGTGPKEYFRKFNRIFQMNFSGSSIKENIISSSLAFLSHDESFKAEISIASEDSLPAISYLDFQKIIESLMITIQRDYFNALNNLYSAFQSLSAESVVSMVLNAFSKVLNRRIKKAAREHRKEEEIDLIQKEISDLIKTYKKEISLARQYTSKYASEITSYFDYKSFFSIIDLVIKDLIKKISKEYSRINNLAMAVKKEWERINKKGESEKTSLIESLATEVYNVYSENEIYENWVKDIISRSSDLNKYMWTEDKKSLKTLILNKLKEMVNNKFNEITFDFKNQLITIKVDNINCLLNAVKNKQKVSCYFMVDVKEKAQANLSQVKYKIKKACTNPFLFEKFLQLVFDNKKLGLKLGHMKSELQHNYEVLQSISTVNVSKFKTHDNYYCDIIFDTVGLIITDWKKDIGNYFLKQNGYKYYYSLISFYNKDFSCEISALRLRKGGMRLEVNYKDLHKVVLRNADFYLDIYSPARIIYDPKTRELVKIISSIPYNIFVNAFASGDIIYPRETPQIIFPVGSEKRLQKDKIKNNTKDITYIIGGTQIPKGLIDLMFKDFYTQSRSLYASSDVIYKSFVVLVKIYTLARGWKEISYRAGRKFGKWERQYEPKYPGIKRIGYP